MVKVEVAVEIGPFNFHPSVVPFLCIAPMIALARKMYIVRE
jgi:hypothetical protein